jgi:hypothetical protein
MYSYKVLGSPPMCQIIKGAVIIDLSGPWESKESAETWATMYVNALNAGAVSPEQPS